MFLHQLYNIRASLFISKSLILIKQQCIYFNHKQNNFSNSIPHTTHHKPNYRVRTPPLPWIEVCSTIFRLNSIFLFFCNFHVLFLSSNPYSFSLTASSFLLVISNNNKITYYSLYALMG